MKIALRRSYSNATDLADWLVLNLGYSFRDAHVLTSKIINYAEKKRLFLNDLKISEYQLFDKRISKSLYSFLNTKNSVNNKKSFGGTSFSEVKKMIALAKKENKK
jgi:argininosuccinate lyase